MSGICVAIFGDLLYDCFIWSDRLPRVGETVTGYASGFFASGKGGDFMMPAFSITPVDSTAAVEAVKAMLDTAKGRIKVKPSGGIRNFETAKMYVDMGVDRLGIGYTSCKPIVEGGTSNEAY